MILGLPMEVFYLLLLVLFVCVIFLYFKRPIYEAMIFGFGFTVVMTGRYDIFMKNLLYPAKDSSLFYIIAGFLTLAYILGETKVVEKLIHILLAIVGGFRGGAGYVALFGSSILAMMTGTGPGNVAATGVFTIPAMKRSGFSGEQAATIEMAASMLGNQMGPGLNLVGFSLLVGLYPEKNYNLGTFWIALWIVGAWLCLQRFITLFIMCRRSGVKPIPPEERPKLKDALKDGWYSLLIPVFILLPVLISSKFINILTVRFGKTGAAGFSSTAMMFTIGVCALFAVLTGRSALKEQGVFSIKGMMGMLKDSISSVVPVSVTIYFAYAISLVFRDLAVADAIQAWFLSFGFNLIGWALFVTLFTAILGRVLPGSAQVALLGTVIISTGAAVGVDPFLVAVVMPAITGVMEGMTPPLALGLMTAIGIAKSKFWPTAKLAYVWILGNMVVSVLLLLGIIPIFVS
jgi:TRAP-type C4-dicarboxylate transport system permease large subunit